MLAHFSLCSAFFSLLAASWALPWISPPFQLGHVLQRVKEACCNVCVHNRSLRLKSNSKLQQPYSQQGKGKTKQRANYGHTCCSTCVHNCCLCNCLCFACGLLWLWLWVWLWLRLWLQFFLKPGFLPLLVFLLLLCFALL